MKYLFFLALAFCAVGCSSNMVNTMKPSHVAFTPSCEWEFQQGCFTKHKPKVTTTVDWHF